MKENGLTFMSRSEFDKAVEEGAKPDCLFPIMDYEFCKYVYEHSPLIESLVKAITSDRKTKGLTNTQDMI